MILCLLKVASLTETLHKKEAEMAGMEERYKKYIEKAKSVIKTLDPKQNPNAAPEVSALKTQLQDKDKVFLWWKSLIEAEHNNHSLQAH